MGRALLNVVVATALIAPVMLLNGMVRHVPVIGYYLRVGPAP